MYILLTLVFVFMELFFLVVHSSMLPFSLVFFFLLFLLFFSKKYYSIILEMHFDTFEESNNIDAVLSVLYWSYIFFLKLVVMNILSLTFLKLMFSTIFSSSKKRNSYKNSFNRAFYSVSCFLESYSQINSFVKDSKNGFREKKLLLVTA